MAFSVTPSAAVPAPHEACDEATVVSARAANDESAVLVIDDESGLVTPRRKLPEHLERIER